MVSQSENDAVVGSGPDAKAHFDDASVQIPETAHHLPRNCRGISLGVAKQDVPSIFLHGGCMLCNGDWCFGYWHPFNLISLTIFMPMTMEVQTILFFLLFSNRTFFHTNVC